MDNEVGKSTLLISVPFRLVCRWKDVYLFMSMDMDMFRTMRPNLSGRSFTWLDTGEIRCDRKAIVVVINR